MHDQQGARNLYLNTDFTQKEIAEKLGLDPKTIYLWIKKGKWDEMKAAARQAPGIIQQQLYNHITAINDAIANREDHIPTFQEVEMLRKLIVSTKHMQQMSIGTYVQAFQELTGFIGPHTNDLEFTKRVAVVADQYIKGLVHNKQFHMEQKVRETTDAIKEVDNGLGHTDTEVTLATSTSTVIERPLSGLERSNFAIHKFTPKSTDPDNEGQSAFDNTTCPNDDVGQKKSGILEKQENTTTPSPSTPSPDIATNKIPDTVVMPDREITNEDKEKHAREVEQIITRKDYIKYEYLLETKTENPDETVDFNGVEVNLMTIQYNLKQFEEPEWRCHFLSRDEVVAAFLARTRPH